MSRGRIVGLWVVLLSLTVAGCAAPQFTYVTNSSQHTYFKVPSGWRQISAGALATAVNGGNSTPQSGVWTVGYDGSAQPAADHVLGAGEPAAVRLLRGRGGQPDDDQRAVLQRPA